MNGGAGPAALGSSGLFSQTLVNGGAASAVQKANGSVGYPASAGTVNLLNYNYGVA